jgi:hypothetical protein
MRGDRPGNRSKLECVIAVADLERTEGGETSVV